MKIFIKDNISHYFLRRDLLPAQELLEEQHDGVTLRCQAAHENQILPLLFYWLPNIQILEPAWLKEKLVKTLEGYLAGSAATVTGDLYHIISPAGGEPEPLAAPFDRSPGTFNHSPIFSPLRAQASGTIAPALLNTSSQRTLTLFSLHKKPGLTMDTKKLLKHVPWALLGILGAFCLAVVALRRGRTRKRPVDRGRVGFRLPCGLSLLQLIHRAEGHETRPTRATPAVINNDGLNYVPTNRYVLFGHHFAAIAGAGPLVGPVLAAQMGYLPGTLWLLAGVVLAGAVQDFMVLFISSRRNGSSLGEMIKEEMGRVPGTIALFGCFLIMIIILAVLALIVVKALAESPWGVFTVCSTVPIALFMGIYMRFLRPGRVGEVSVIGIVLLVASIYFGGVIAHDPYWGPALTFKDTTITFALIGYAFISALLPVWLILAPRDYLATFLKIGVIVGWRSVL
ncbi:carbon starvation protein CstA [Enterobacter cloacae]|uniref:Carbon starvation protein CstA n=1 Tax=Enterobacter cloacae TaxID=550 RepID=A0A377M7B8_ENTCL|nr:carbon starvation protein CstA [Enterobacter cloacae]